MGASLPGLYERTKLNWRNGASRDFKFNYLMSLLPGCFLIPWKEFARSLNFSSSLFWCCSGYPRVVNIATAAFHRSKVKEN